MVWFVFSFVVLLIVYIKVVFGLRRIGLIFLCFAFAFVCWCWLDLVGLCLLCLLWWFEVGLFGCLLVGLFVFSWLFVGCGCFGCFFVVLIDCVCEMLFCCLEVCTCLIVWFNLWFCFVLLVLDSCVMWLWVSVFDDLCLVALWLFVLCLSCFGFGFAYLRITLCLLLILLELWSFLVFVFTGVDLFVGSWMNIVVLLLSMFVVACCFVSVCCLLVCVVWLWD